MDHTELYNFILKQGRVPYFHKDFPLILFWSQKSGCTSLAHWFFYQINLFKEAIKYESFIHNYEYDVYKNSTKYLIQVAIALQIKEKNTYKLVRSPYKRAVSSFTSLISPPNISHPAWKPIRLFLYGDETCNKPISFKLFLYYLRAHMNKLDEVDPHYSQQYIEGEEEFVTNYIYLENFNTGISKLEEEYKLKKSPLDLLSKSWHYQASKMIYKGVYAEADITTPIFTRFPTYDSFYDAETIQLVQEVFAKDFNMYHYDLNPIS
ncbi:sulfotransferase family 2 domain-containing protein [Bacillus cereus]|nr:sulfotransferase family 2 domain-containing protein [Bacillus cereus]MEC2744575.1 sulfotransferase family 2 domain-containing protein [Bacillus cereus]MEC2757659.1 sulfotransferase family 2 domain-containing protein [Bacillus cereus]MEC2830304.1 sulfotransferase family 2 domain-containing protein [Bacillus cereus]